jgi:general secretion pathway protein L
MREPITIDLGAPARIGDVPELVGRFMAWWFGELRALLPWRRSLPASAQRDPVLYARRDGWRLKPSAGAVAVALDTTTSDGDLVAQILELAHGASLSRMTLVIRHVDMPQMAPAHVQQAVELQVDRLSPFKADAVRTATRVVGSDREKGTVSVDIAIAPLLRVRPIEQRLAAMGLTPAQVDVEGEDGRPAGFDLSEPPSGDAVQRRRVVSLALGVAAAGLWGLAIYAWNEAGESEIRDWEARIAGLRPAAARSAAVRADVESLVQPIMRANAHDPAATLDVLLQLTRAMPDTSRVLDLAIEGESVRLSGIANSAPGLIGALETSTAFKGVRFTSPVVRSGESGLERFEIAMQLEKGALQ